jgi:hypothetical protein
MVVTLVGFILARFIVAISIRPHFMAPVTKAIRLNPNAGWGFTDSGSGMQVSTDPPDLPNALITSSQIVNRAGQSPTGSFLRKACPNLPGVNGTPPSPGGSRSAVAVPEGGQQAFQHCVNAVSAKFHLIVTYQPANRFWTFQTYETALFVVASLVLAGLCAWWVRHRLS